MYEVPHDKQRTFYQNIKMRTHRRTGSYFVLITVLTPILSLAERNLKN